MDTDIDTRAGRVNPAEKEKTMKKSDVIKVLEAIRDNDYNQALEDKK